MGQPTSLFPWIHTGLDYQVRKMSSEDVILPDMLGKLDIWINFPSLAWVRQQRMVSEKTADFAKLFQSRFYFLSTASEHMEWLEVRK